ncbi:hypothetical protein EDC61_11482 [Sulfuritortus calidifontis]|uniref:Bacteriophage Rz lysis protein n=1 Tax=Sulfuritortus calidifontis TaxID=1914471 RepID=A0A4R3JTN6_9PROT|nr:hypothetical protein [Sulfuritortus calidifontis]TCS70755.1 hypothetical protein EDC61_11482 [Sulfuritortus calidifontis]
MIQATSHWPVIAAALICVGAGFAGGYTLKGRLDEAAIARAEAGVAECRRASADFQRRAAEDAAHRLAAAEDAARSAQAELSRREADFKARLKETRNEIYSLSTGRECLAGPLRLRLNAAIAADSVPARAGEPHPAPAEPAADPGGHAAGSTDAAVGQWILDAASLYEQCRARIDAIRQWDEVTHGR